LPDAQGGAIEQGPQARKEGDPKAIAGKSEGGKKKKSKGAPEIEKEEKLAGADCVKAGRPQSWSITEVLFGL